MLAISGLMNNTVRWSAYLKECVEAVLGLSRLEVRPLLSVTAGPCPPAPSLVPRCRLPAIVACPAASVASFSC